MMKYGVLVSCCIRNVPWSTFLLVALKSLQSVCMYVIRTRLFVLEDLHELGDADDFALDVLDILADGVVEDGR